ncbi:PREDICTED: uncharacterized protein LOC109152717 [Ipomoea nil]|uniref:uncharacterized protein LOC109152717 n=1 Tax=Ipomoea nil TaxID=35883 RepID=UPI0009010169|nr:PREDICTED: uncharacterized protein LOC109152717 [Ipomoea nil]
MVSERFQPISYVAVVTGGADQGERTTPQPTQSPIHATSSTIPQGNPIPQAQRSYGVEDVRIQVKNKWWIIDSSIAAPNSEDNRYGLWRRCNLMLCSWIFRSVHPSIAQSVMHLENARDVWNDLKRRFAQCDAQRISALQNDIYSLKQGSQSVSDYYTKCRIMWEEMNTLRPLPLCKCGLVDEIRKEREVDQVIRFLQGLNDDFNTLKSNVLMLDPLPEVYKIYVMAEKLERRISLMKLNINNFEISHANSIQATEMVQNSSDDLVAAINTFNGKKYTNNGGSKPKCSFCGMIGHTVDKCYKKHGYPRGGCRASNPKSSSKEQLLL